MTKFSKIFRNIVPKFGTFKFNSALQQGGRKLWKKVLVGFSSISCMARVDGRD